MNYYAHISGCDQFITVRKNLFLSNKGKVGHMPGKGNFTAVIDAFLSKLQVIFVSLIILFLTFFKKGYPSTIYTVLKTSEKVQNHAICDTDRRCPMCLTLSDSTMVLESGFDKELIGSDPEKLSIAYL
jgi:Cytoplasmic tRNA 2-thiolation protein 2